MVEFWSAATRPASANGLGLSPEQTAKYIDQFPRLSRILSETPDIFPLWRELVLSNPVSGAQVHDARIVAAMIVHGIDRILTFDVLDFKRYVRISVVDPYSP
jgi:predicted nucleic acid-binding protein